MSLSHELSASARVLSAPLKPHCFTDKGSVTQEFYLVVAQDITPLLWQDGKPTGSIPVMP